MRTFIFSLDLTHSRLNALNFASDFKLKYFFNKHTIFSSENIECSLPEYHVKKLSLPTTWKNTF